MKWSNVCKKLSACSDIVEAILCLHFELLNFFTMEIMILQKTEIDECFCPREQKRTRNGQKAFKNIASN